MTTDTAASGTDVRQKAEETASVVAEQAQQTATSQLTTQKEKAASTLDTVAQTLRESGENLRQEQPQIASLTDEAARRVEDVSAYVREHDVRDFVRETERFARREPLLFLGGAFAVGFVVARFLKASSPSGDGNGRAGRGTGEDTSYGSYRWQPARTGGGYDAGTTGYGEAATGGAGAIGSSDYVTGASELAGGSEYATPSDTTYAGATSEFGERSDYGETVEGGAQAEFGDPQMTEIEAGDEEPYRSATGDR